MTISTNHAQESEIHLTPVLDFSHSHFRALPCHGSVGSRPLRPPTLRCLCPPKSSDASASNSSQSFPSSCTGRDDRKRRRRPPQNPVGAASNQPPQEPATNTWRRMMFTTGERSFSVTGRFTREVLGHRREGCSPLRQRHCHHRHHHRRRCRHRPHPPKTPARCGWRAWIV